MVHQLLTDHVLNLNFLVYQIIPAPWNQQLPWFSFNLLFDILNEAPEEKVDPGYLF